MTEVYTTVRNSEKELQLARRERMMDALKDAYRAGKSGLILSELAKRVGTTTANIAKLRNKHPGLFASAVIDLSMPHGASNTYVSGHPDLVRHWVAA